MTTIPAKCEGGVFRPLKPVNLPESAEVDLTVSATPTDEEMETPKQKRDREEILQILSRSYNSGQTDTAERHKMSISHEGRFSRYCRLGRTMGAG